MRWYYYYSNLQMKKLRLCELLVMCSCYPDNKCWRWDPNTDYIWSQRYSLHREFVQWSAHSQPGILWVWSLADSPSRVGHPAFAPPRDHLSAHRASRKGGTLCHPYTALLSIRRVGGRFHQYMFGPSSVCRTISSSSLFRHGHFLPILRLFIVLPLCTGPGSRGFRGAFIWGRAVAAASCNQGSQLSP